MEGGQVNDIVDGAATGGEGRFQIGEGQRT
jgi:hypothetical protein